MICKEMGLQASVDWFGIESSRIKFLSDGEHIPPNVIIKKVKCPAGASRQTDCTFTFADGRDDCEHTSIIIQKTIVKRKHTLILVCKPRPGEFKTLCISIVLLNIMQ